MDVPDILAWCASHAASDADRQGMARYGIRAEQLFGVPLRDLRPLAKRIGRDHDLARRLMSSGWHEGRMLAALVAEPAKLTTAEMDDWAARCENWAECDALCMHLFDRSTHACGRIAAWARAGPELVRRAGFALMATVARRERDVDAATLCTWLEAIDAAADDGRNLVKKGVSWALRAIGQRDPAAHEAALERARRLMASDDGTRRWIGRDALRDLSRPAVRARVAKRPPRREETA